MLLTPKEIIRRVCPEAWLEIGALPDPIYIAVNLEATEDKSTQSMQMMLSIAKTTPKEIFAPLIILYYRGPWRVNRTKYTFYLTERDDRIAIVNANYKFVNYDVQAATILYEEKYKDAAWLQGV